ncbi:Uncharacterised protein [Vibrio cholerae]|uniref:Uncharacterized protein n=1 Tax=Vibrio cholerae TaxID=666 RepID=A0A655Y4K7_VIBCL|nr:Uncharacterised protein [Vibrio cholerae]CSB31913.1 Uncharacterised protein [Vibrio cholerae]CSC30293.1 Uncharacterised protein [Vibrio cholerae]CSC74112.1 Uncharacterised protein [Vibrio cholerae]CSC80481.1 Uncharacterised protein [Vibrio cholerae]
MVADSRRGDGANVNPLLLVLQNANCHGVVNTCGSHAGGIGGTIFITRGDWRVYVLWRTVYFDGHARTFDTSTE